MRASEVVRSLGAGLIIFVAGLTASAGQSAGTKAMPCDGNVTLPMFSQVGTSEAAVKAFLVALQKAVASDDRRKVASMIRYPIVAWARDRDVLFKTPASFVASYELVFTAPLKKTIAEARTECLFTNWQGVMIHDGEIWINALRPRVLKIIRINPPVGGEQQVKPSRPAFKVHPKVFSLIECWETDSGCPVVTEINLDAVAANSNQFSPKDIKDDGEWITCPTENGRGFTRYRTMETAGNRYTVEYQDNGGGTLTMAAIIEFIVEKRVLRKDGKPKSVRVLRLLAFRVM